MIYLDHAATSFPKPFAVKQAVQRAMACCTNPGRGGYPMAMEAAACVYRCREAAAALLECVPEQVVLTSNCTHSLNIAIRTVLTEGGKVVISGFEHNAVTRLLHAMQARITVAGRKLFDWQDTLESFENALKQGQDAAIVTHVSNVFGYILPVEQIVELCKKYGVPCVVDGAQSAGHLPLSMKKLGADFVAMPGHKGLLGPQGTGLLLCGSSPKPWMYGGTGNLSLLQTMPEDLPERAEAGTVNVPGIAGLEAGIRTVQKLGLEEIGNRERKETEKCAKTLENMRIRVFCGPHQSGVVSFVPEMDCEDYAYAMAQRGIALRAGLHCAPLAHESAGTLETGTVRVSFGHTADQTQSKAFLTAVRELQKGRK